MKQRSAREAARHLTHRVRRPLANLSQRRLPVWAVLLACGGILAGAALLPSWPVDVQAFDSNVWKAAKAGSELRFPRQAMADDLIARRALLGRPRTDVERELGRPDRGGAAPQRAYYWTGPERRLISIDAEWLVVEYDDNGLVSRVLISSS